jgi:hypothetical protein
MAKGEENRNETAGAKIRNRLQPPLTLADLVEKTFGTKEYPKKPSEEDLEKVSDFLRESAENAKESVAWILGFSRRHCEFVPKDSEDNVQV